MSRIQNIDFKFLSPMMIKKMATVKIDKAELYDPDGYPIDGGLSDLRLGVVDPGLRCRVCGGTAGNCFGHFGYMELTKPVIHPLYGKKIYMMLKSTCRKCGSLLADKESGKLTLSKVYKNPKAVCPECGEKQKKISFEKPTTMKEGAEYLTAEQVRERLEKISDDDLDLLRIKGGRPEWYVLTLLPIPPVTTRPSITLESGERSEDDLTHKLVDVIRINERLKKNLELGAPEFIILDIWELLQYHVSTLMNNEISTLPPSRHRSGRSLKTIAQRLMKKEGRFRGNLTGKRVNFSARTVISPDTRISLNEVGVPEAIAKELTVPDRVIEKNKEKLKKYVLNGPEIYPGANYIIRPDGIKKKITDENKELLAEEVEIGYKVERHMIDEDVVIFNRQPSLHRMSIMAHKAKILPYRTFRLNLCTTVPYNADFDGDEMNLHVPQTEEARVEAELLMSAEKHIRSPRYGLPLISCKHDQISGLYLLTKKDTKLDKKQAANMFMLMDKDVDELKDSYTGKEIISELLPKDLNMEFKSSACMGCAKCKKQDCPYDSYVVIKNGELKQGVIDDNALGERKGKLLNKIDLKYGPDFSREFLDNISKLGLEFITKHGFTISSSDMEIADSSTKHIEKLLEEGSANVDKLISDYKKGKITKLAGIGERESFEMLVQQETGNIMNKISKYLKSHIAENNAVVMAKSGARGSYVNITQTAAIVGQKAIFGERIFRGYKERTLSHFKRDDIGLKAHGFIYNGYKKGLDPFEFFFDAMNSRENLMDKSLQTRHSGYLERRLVNALQDLIVENDGTVRNTKRKIVQFIAGEDGIDPGKSDNGDINLEDLE